MGDDRHTTCVLTVAATTSTPSAKERIVDYRLVCFYSMHAPCALRGLEPSPLHEPRSGGCVLHTVFAGARGRAGAGGCRMVRGRARRGWRASRSDTWTHRCPRRGSGGTGDQGGPLPAAGSLADHPSGG